MKRISKIKGGAPNNNNSSNNNTPTLGNNNSSNANNTPKPTNNSGTKLNNNSGNSGANNSGNSGANNSGTKGNNSGTKGNNGLGLGLSKNNNNSSNVSNTTNVKALGNNGNSNNKNNSFFKNITNKASNSLSSMSDTFTSSKFGGFKKYLIIIIICIVILLLIFLGKHVVTKYHDYRNKTPYIIPGTKNANNSVVISQDKDSINYIEIARSTNEDGIEFTYSWWTFYEQSNLNDNNTTDWKHVFHKGNPSSYPLRAPGVWFHKDKNTMRVYMNTFNKILEYVDIEDIPVKKWFHCAIVLQNKRSRTNEIDKDVEIDDNNHILDIYINGSLAKSKILDMPKQNESNLWINLYNGFNGYISKLKYFNYAIKYSELEDIVKEGPSLYITNDTGEMPPYLDDTWWLNQTN